jgi:hypothetical protein
MRTVVFATAIVFAPMSGDTPPKSPARAVARWILRALDRRRTSLDER